MNSVTATYMASWGTPLKVVTAICVAIVLGAPIVGMIASGMLTTSNLGLVLKTILLSCLVLLIIALFMVRGYMLTTNQLIVKRLFWETTVDLNGLVSAEVDPRAMSNSWRVFGNGGLFSMTGIFWNKKLGRYRAFATDEKHSVILRFRDRVIVITPDKPQDFVAKLRNLTQTDGLP